MILLYKDFKLNKKALAMEVSILLVNNSEQNNILAFFLKICLEFMIFFYSNVFFKKFVGKINVELKFKFFETIH